MRPQPPLRLAPHNAAGVPCPPRPGPAHQICPAGLAGIAKHGPGSHHFLQVPQSQKHAPYLYYTKISPGPTSQQRGRLSRKRPFPYPTPPIHLYP
ncbi:hypothetical protein NDU88_003037 [Pleurodeles waltl]|uniref:Uncharacterized protein n=1 Tax=Pleurodeles waltl TaxID=8319 RepID=A0AAV7W521_PLEWA|nr:hypothetical protein NDU88_003037 [Pleurodeles waltl]